jgi:hypothetical protein
MAKAWVISLTIVDGYFFKEYKGDVKRVLQVLSARNSVEQIKKHIENLYYMFFTDLEEQIAATKYNQPQTPPTIESTADCVVYCFVNHALLAAQLSDLIEVEKKDDAPLLKWQGIKYKEYGQDSNHQIYVKEEVEPPVTKTPQARFDIPHLFDWENE